MQVQVLHLRAFSLISHRPHTRRRDCISPSRYRTRRRSTATHCRRGLLRRSRISPQGRHDRDAALLAVLRFQRDDDEAVAVNVRPLQGAQLARTTACLDERSEQVLDVGIGAASRMRVDLRLQSIGRPVLRRSVLWDGPSVITFLAAEMPIVGVPTRNVNKTDFTL